jgi:hypothetical protein
MEGETGVAPSGVKTGLFSALEEIRSVPPARPAWFSALRLTGCVARTHRLAGVRTQSAGAACSEIPLPAGRTGPLSHRQKRGGDFKQQVFPAHRGAWHRTPGRL